MLQLFDQWVGPAIEARKITSEEAEAMRTDIAVEYGLLSAEGAAFGASWLTQWDNWASIATTSADTIVDQAARVASALRLIREGKLTVQRQAAPTVGVPGAMGGTSAPSLPPPSVPSVRVPVAPPIVGPTGGTAQGNTFVYNPTINTLALPNIAQDFGIMRALAGV